MTPRPTGTVTVLFSDIEDSTARLAELGTEKYHAALEEHRRLLRDAVAQHAGHEFGAVGDALFVAFGSAQDATTSGGRGRSSARLPQKRRGRRDGGRISRARSRRR